CIGKEDTSGNIKYIYSRITLSLDADYAVILSPGSVGGARLKDENLCNWACVELQVKKIPLYIDITYDLDGGVLKSGQLPKKVLNHRGYFNGGTNYEKYLVFSTRPVKEGNHLDFMAGVKNEYDYYSFERVSEEYPNGAAGIPCMYDPGIEASLTIAAYWSPGGTITYHTNGGKLDGIEDPVKEFDLTSSGRKKVDISAAVPARTGKIFKGWYSDEALTQKVDSYADIDSNTNPSEPGDYIYHLYAKWEDAPIEIRNATVENVTNRTYTGSAIKPVPAVEVDGKKLTAGTDFTYSYKNNKNVGTATITMTGKGKYTGTVTKTFKIVSSITLSRKTATLGTKNAGKYTKTLQLTATVKSNNQTVTWTSSNTKIAKVDPTGKVTGLSDPDLLANTVTITAKTSDGKTATCKVTVEDPVNAFIRRLYKLCLGRNPDKTGFANWKQRLNSKQKTAAQAVQGFFLSNEFKNKNLSDEEFVIRCYRVLLNREPDAKGKQNWLNRMKNQGYTRKRVLKGFVESSEFTNICKNYGITRGTITLN
ncbi:MAG: DUF4214 domain-containing protein, partial [Lachnospiraceae bacterium]|nr:DUF4214 domain-containing protein [Lachnospiraceae bacterium]